MTQQATITAQYINPPKGKGPASIKDTNGVYWKVWTTGKNPIPLETFRENGTYLVGYKTEQYNGKDQYTITAAQDVTGGQLAPSAPSIQPALTPHAPGPRHAITSASDSKEVFMLACCGIKAAAPGKFDPLSAADYASALSAASAGYKAWKNKAELNDDIPRL